MGFSDETSLLCNNKVIATPGSEQSMRSKGCNNRTCPVIMYPAIPCFLGLVSNTH
jgi:hypothetical protein